MASESSEDEPLRVRLPTELEEWLDSRATELDRDRETVLVQLVASYRAAADLDGDASAADDLAVDVAGPEAVGDVVGPSVERAAAAAVDEALDERLSRDVEAALADRLDDAVGDRLDDRLDGRIADRVDRHLDERFEDGLDDRLEDQRAAFQQKIEDVRERVVQVKQEVDGKAPVDHDHEELAGIEAVGRRLADVEERLEGLEADLEAIDEERGEAVAELEGDLEEVRERLQTVAWVARDLREAFESRGSAAALERIKRQAAAADLTRAKCEGCGEGVEIGLLTEPACPHCDATVATVEPASGFFGTPRLLVASQLEAGDDE